MSLTPVEVAAPKWFPDRLAAQDQWAYMMAFVFALLGLVVVWAIARAGSVGR